MDRIDSNSKQIPETVSFADVGDFVRDSIARPDKRLNQAVEVTSALVQGGLTAIADDAKYHPERLAVHAATGFAVGAAFGVALSCEIPAVAGAATVGGAYMMGDWLAHLGHKIYTNKDIRSNLDQVWMSGRNKDSSLLKTGLASDGKDLIIGTVCGTAGMAAGARANAIPVWLKTLGENQRPVLALENGMLEPKGKALGPKENTYMMSGWRDGYNEAASDLRASSDSAKEIAKLIERGDLEQAAKVSSKCRDGFEHDKTVNGENLINFRMGQMFDKATKALDEAREGGEKLRGELLEYTRKLFQDVERTKNDLDKWREEKLADERRRIQEREREREYREYYGRDDHGFGR